jgi:hypothetical protein
VHEGTVNFNGTSQPPIAGYDRGECTACAGTGRVPNVAPETTRYLHVTEKYNPPEWARGYLAPAPGVACKVATPRGVPAEF